MKRLLYQYQSKIYDYSTIDEALKHKNEMIKKGWSIHHDDNGWYVHNDICINTLNELPFSIEYYKEGYN